MKQESLIFNKRVPSRLKKIQRWFASILTMPIDEDSQMHPLSPSGECMEEEAFDYIIPSPALRPAQRIQIYNQQYWWRLFKVLQEVNPFILRLFGHHDFNQTIAMPYLIKYPPDTWSLNTLGNNLPVWIEKEYQAKDKLLVLDAAKIDTALNIAFFSQHYKKVDSRNFSEEILEKKMRLQPHVFLFDLRYDLFSFRKEIMKEDVDYWMTHDFPKLVQDRRHYFVLYRNQNNNVTWEEVSHAAFELLKHFQNGSTVENVCEWLEQQDNAIFLEAEKNLHLWFQEWIFREWLYIIP